VAQHIEGYIEVSDEDRKKAQVWFGHAAKPAGQGNYDYAIELYINGLTADPEAVEAHQTLRDISLKRKASGGKALGMFEAMKLKRPSKDDKQNLLNAEKLLAFDPGNTDHMLWLIQSAYKAGCYDTVLWIGPILQKANADSPKPDVHKFLALKDIYRGLKKYKLAVEACHYALQLRPDDMDLQKELKDLGAMQTMADANYGGSFRDAIKDKDAQDRLIEGDKDVRTEDSLMRSIKEAQAEYAAEPNEPGKLLKLVEALERTDTMEHENHAIELLEAAYKKTGQFRHRGRAGQIKMKQLSRMERTLRAEAARNPGDKEAQDTYRQFRIEKAEEELKEYQLASEAYPTDLSIKYQIAQRLFELGKHDEAIPKFQEAVQDAKVRNDATIYLGRAFLEAGFVDESVDTLKGLVESYQIQGDERAKQIYYYFARALEAQGDTAASIKAYSKVAQWDFNYRDVQSRIKALRAKPQA
jgi:tetratricopeptide (TPR) repeat protein